MVNNQASFSVIVVGFCNGEFGRAKLVMPGIPEKIDGPLFLSSAEGDFYYEIKRSFTVISAGVHDPEVSGTLLVMPGRPASFVWYEGDTKYGVRAKHYQDN